MGEPIGARKAGTFIAVSDAPDPCRTPPGNVPVPYLVMAGLEDALAASSDVAFNGHPVVLAGRSTLPRVTGDEAGSGGGVKSGCHGGEVAFVRGAGTVRVNGLAVVREGDPVTLNQGNTTGRVVCLDGAGPTGGITPGGQLTVDTNLPQVQPPERLSG
jgi:hypothetical protein